jgi:hypothetical protein
MMAVQQSRFCRGLPALETNECEDMARAWAWILEAAKVPAEHVLGAVTHAIANHIDTQPFGTPQILKAWRALHEDLVIEQAIKAQRRLLEGYDEDRRNAVTFAEFLAECGDSLSEVERRGLGLLNAGKAGDILSDMEKGDPEQD